MKRLCINIFESVSAFVNKYIFSRATLVTALLMWFVFSITWTLLSKNDVWWSDYGLYQYFATECLKHHSMYPDYSFLHYEYIFAPGWVNILELWHLIFKSFSGVPYLLLGFNTFNIYLLWLICKALSDRKAIRYIVVYSYLLIPSFATNSIILASEVPYITFSLLSFYLCLRQESTSVIFAGLCIAIALWIRPLADAWIISALFLFLITKRYNASLLYVISVVSSCVIIALCTHINFPDYVYKATTGGVNLIMGANDEATGIYCPAPRAEGGSAYLSGLRTSEDTPVLIHYNSEKYIKKCSNVYRYNEIDKHYKEKAIEWILEHPIKWLSLIPNKIRYLLFNGTFEAYPLPSAKFMSTKLIRYMYKWQTFFVTIIVIISLLGMTFPKSWRDKKQIYVLIPIILASAMTCICVTMPRYNYIFTPLLLIYFAYTILAIHDTIKNWIHNERKNSIY